MAIPANWEGGPPVLFPLSLSLCLWPEKEVTERSLKGLLRPHYCTDSALHMLDSLPLSSLVSWWPPLT